MSILIEAALERTECISTALLLVVWRPDNRGFLLRSPSGQVSALKRTRILQLKRNSGAVCSRSGLEGVGAARKDRKPSAQGE